MTTVQITLPDQLAQDAQRAGLLSPARLEKWLRDQLEGQRVDELFSAMNRMAGVDEPAAMSPEDVARTRLCGSNLTLPAVKPVACLPNCEEKRCVMAIPIDVLEAEALSLPPADRSRLVDRLLASLGHDPEWEQAWSEEADRREARIVDGQAQWVNGPDALARIRVALK